MAGYIVLAPQGLPEDENQREHCLDLLRRLGADLSRVYESKAVETLEKIGLVAERSTVRRTEALVVFTNTAPLSLTVLRERRRITQSYPGLRVAAWVIYVDSSRDPHFFDTARQSGEFDRPDDEAPIWRAAADGLDYIVLSPELGLTRGESLVGRLILLQRSRTRGSTRMPAASLRATSETASVPPNRW